ncbi:hypothetical protein ACFXTO_008416 [Malus domestica]
MFPNGKSTNVVIKVDNPNKFITLITSERDVTSEAKKTKVICALVMKSLLMTQDRKLQIPNKVQAIRQDFEDLVSDDIRMSYLSCRIYNIKSTSFLGQACQICHTIGCV